MLFACLSSLAALWPVAANAQTKPTSAAASSAATKSSTAPTPSTGPAWSELKPLEQTALKPLRNEWTSIDDLGKRKWLQIAERYPTMSVPDQARLQTRMAEWAKLTPQERGKVRLQFLEAKKIPATDRQADWEAYQALSPDERKALAARATTAPRAAAKVAEPIPRSASAKRNAPRAASVSTAHAAASAPTAKPATPTLVQGAPGATTVLITKHQAPPAHPATGSAKIVVSPDVVDKSTLLPRAGAQSPRTRPTASSAPAARP